LEAYYVNLVEEMADFREWCISETNYWGIPIPFFKYKEEREKVFTNSEVIQHVADLFSQHGSDCWHTLSVKDLLPDKFKSISEELIKGDEVFDVWFDSSLQWATLTDSYMNEDFLKLKEQINTSITQIDPNFSLEAPTVDDIISGRRSGKKM
jgi:isoleucyl-tRNA synthetase